MRLRSSGRRWSRRSVALFPTIAAVLLPAIAHAAPAITSPTAGQVVRLDSHYSYPVTWTLEPGESMPLMYTGTTPTYDPSTFYPWNPGCTDTTGSGDQSTSCTMGSYGLEAGTHYVTVLDSNNDANANYTAPTIQYEVAKDLRLGCTGLLTCNSETGAALRAFKNWPDANISPSQYYSGVIENTRLNAPGSTVTYAFTFRSAGRVVKHATIVRKARDDDFWSQASVKFGHVRGVTPKGKVKATIVTTGDGLTLTEHVTFRAPPVTVG